MADRILVDRRHRRRPDHPVTVVHIRNIYQLHSWGSSYCLDRHVGDISAIVHLRCHQQPDHFQTTKIPLGGESVGWNYCLLPGIDGGSDVSARPGFVDRYSRLAHLSAFSPCADPLQSQFDVVNSGRGARRIYGLIAEMIKGFLQVV